MEDTKELLSVSSSPHIRSKRKTRYIMLDVIIALIPALIVSVFVLGVRSILVTLVCVLSCVCAEILFKFISKKPQSVGDLSAVVTGILIAFNLPVTIPFYMPVLASFFAIIVVKELFGGIGCNIVNPALAARVFLFISFPAYMVPTNPAFDRITEAFDKKLINPDIVTVASATPLTSISNKEMPVESFFDVFIGNMNGIIGEISACALLIGGIYLMIRKVISWHIPVSYIGTVAAVSAFAYFFIGVPDGMSAFSYVFYEVMCGGLMLCAVFMATDYTTSPVTKSGKIIFGILCGLITMFIRLFSSNSEGASFAVLICNLLVFYIDKFTMPKKFGYRKEKKRKKESEQA